MDNSVENLGESPVSLIHGKLPGKLLYTIPSGSYGLYWRISIYQVNNTIPMVHLGNSCCFTFFCNVFLRLPMPAMANECRPRSVFDGTPLLQTDEGVEVLRLVGYSSTLTTGSTWIPKKDTICVWSRPTPGQ